MADSDALRKEYGIPDKFIPAVKEMHRYVSALD